MFRPKITALLLFSLLFSSFSSVKAADQSSPSVFTALSDFSKISTAVKIISYDYSYNGDIYQYQSGSGTIIRNDGLVLTNNHVVQDEKEKALSAFEICLSVDPNKEPICEYTAHLIARSLKDDLALIKIDPSDIRGNPIGSLPYLDYNYPSEPKVGDQIKITGFPDTGGETITTTQGVISGFTEANQADSVKYIKSDTDISSGNSGGTTTDQDGHFIGIPTMAVSSLDTLGYSIDLNSVRPWITGHINEPPGMINKNNLLKPKKVIFNDAEATNNLLYPYYPAFSLQKDSTWKFAAIEKNVVSLFSDTSKERDYELDLRLERLPFKVQEQYLEKIFQKIEKNKNMFINYKRTKTTFAGVPAHLITFNTSSSKAYNYFIPYGYAVLSLNYDLDLKNLERDETKFKSILDTFKFKEAPKDPPSLEKYTHPDPAFSLKTKGKFKIAKNENAADKNLIIKLMQSDNFEGEFNVNYYELDEGQKTLTNDQILEKNLEDVDFLSGFSLINKDLKVVIDGLTGWSLTYSYEGDDYQMERKTSEVFLRQGEFYFLISYDDLEKKYDENLNSFKSILKTFQFAGENPDKGIYNIGSLNFLFSDIVNHRFAGAVANLKDKGVITGYPDGTFRPEAKISRAEALKIILESKLYNKDASLDKRKEIEKYKNAKYKKLDFSDNKTIDWYTPYLRYARDKKITQGYKDAAFKPNNYISLAEVLVFLFKTNEIKVWQPKEKDSGVMWFKPYMDKGFELGLIPPDLFDPARIVTRAELAYIVDGLSTEIDNSSRY